MAFIEDRRSFRRAFTMTALIAITASVVWAPRVSAAVGGDWIAFTRDPTGGPAFESGDEEIYAIRLDGTGAVRLTVNSCSDITPDASPDGRWLAWVQKCGSIVDIIG